MKGEIASFPSNQAARLIDAGYAEPHREEKKVNSSKKQSDLSKDVVALKALKEAPQTKDVKPDKSKAKKDEKKDKSKDKK